MSDFETGHVTDFESKIKDIVTRMTPRDYEHFVHELTLNSEAMGNPVDLIESLEKFETWRAEA